MGGIGQRIEISGEGDAAALQQAIWERVQTAWRMWSVPGESGAPVEDYLLEGDDPGAWDGEEGALTWMFRDYAGNCTASMYATLHWLNLALASDWKGVLELADQHGFEVKSPAPPLSCDGQLVILRGALWLVDEENLTRDGAWLPLQELDAQERSLALEALAGCSCSACAFVRPDPSIASGFVRALDGAPEPEVLSSLAWYLTRMKDPGSELIEAMGRAVERDPASSRPLLDAMESLAPRVDCPGSLVLRLAWREGRGTFDRQELLEALRAPAPASGLAAELAVRHLHEERQTLWPLVVQIADAPDADEETRHRVVLALVNLFLPRGPAPVPVFALFQREAEREPDAQGPSAASLARWALGVFAPTVS